MSEMVKLTAELREDAGTGSARKLRRENRVPAIIYGHGKKNLSISLEEKEITKLYRRHGFTSTVIELEIDGKQYNVLPKSIDLHPITDVVRHADFIFLGTTRQKVQVPLVFVGTDKSLGLKRGGYLNVVKRRVEIDCPVKSIPLDIQVDVSKMRIGSSIRAKSLNIPEGCKLLTRSDIAVVSITGRGGKDTGGDAEGAEA